MAACPLRGARPRRVLACLARLSEAPLAASISMRFALPQYSTGLLKTQSTAAHEAHLLDAFVSRTAICIY